MLTLNKFEIFFSFGKLTQGAGDCLRDTSDAETWVGLSCPCPSLCVADLPADVASTPLQGHDVVEASEEHSFIPNAGPEERISPG